MGYREDCMANWAQKFAQNKILFTKNF